MRKKIVFVSGTRPEVIKIYPVYKKFKDDNRYETLFISTGQQREFSNQVKDLFGFSFDIDLDLMKPDQSLGTLTILLLEKLTMLFNQLKPDFIFVQGDTTTAFAAGLTAFYQKIVLGHIEAGLRSGDNYSPFPEEGNRSMLSSICSFNFAPTETSKKNLTREGKKNIYVTGNTVVDSMMLLKNQLHINDYSRKPKFDFLVSDKKTILITLHRRELQGKRLRNVLNTLKQIADNYSYVQFVFPVHLNPNIRNEVFEILGKTRQFNLIEPVSYTEMLQLIQICYFIITDSGGLQEEAPSFKKPVLVLRDKTERTEGIEKSIAFLSGYENEKILRLFNQLMDDIFYKQTIKNLNQNPYGDGKASERIKKIIDDFFQIQ